MKSFRCDMTGGMTDIEEIKVLRANLEGERNIHHMGQAGKIIM